MRSILFALALTFGAGALAAQETDPIGDLIMEERFEDAFAKAQAIAAEGDVKAHDWLGEMYENGVGVERSRPKAASHYRIAAAKGENHARWRLGVMIDQQEAEGTLEEAVFLFQTAANEGYTNALVSLAVMQATGRGTPEDFIAALANYTRAGKLGNAHAIQGVGVMHALGQGVEEDIEEAAAWFLVSAYAGSPAGADNFEQAIEGMSEEQMRGIAKRALAVGLEMGVDIKFDPPASPEQDESSLG